MNEIKKGKLTELLEDANTFIIKCDTEGSEWDILSSKLLRSKLKIFKRVDLFLSVHLGFYSLSYHKSYFKKLFIE